MTTTDGAWGALTILGLAVVTVVTRGFFLFPEREVKIPDWLQRGLKVAPLAALAAVVVPEVIMTRGALIATWQDARLPAVLAASIFHFREYTIQEAKEYIHSRGIPMRV